MNWPHLHPLLTRLCPYSERMALLQDLAIVALAWQGTTLFNLGFERWFSARRAYDLPLLAGLLLVYALMFVLLRAPKGMWRFSGFGEVQRLAGTCLLAGLIGALGVPMAHLHGVPRAVLGLHPLFR